MKTILFVLLISLFGQQSPLYCAAKTDNEVKDVFPLGLGRSWEYKFESDYAARGPETPHPYGYSDTGAVRYTVLDSISNPNSISWTIKCSRTLLHHEYDLGAGFDTTYAIIDSATFHLNELLTGRHKLTVDNAVNASNPIWTFLTKFCDTNVVYRYQSVYRQTSVINLYFCTEPYYTQMVFYADSGLISSSRDEFTNEEVISIDATLRSAILTKVYAKSYPPSEISGMYLEPVFPNPFNSSAIISFSIPTSNYVVLSVFNALGQNVAVLTNKYLPAGKYSLPWNAGALPSGLYFVRLISNNHTQVTKCLLLK